MDDPFVPPGYMAVTELLELAGQALLKDEWLGVEAPAAERGLLEEIHRRHRHGERGSFLRMLGPLNEARRRRGGQRVQVITALRVALCTSVIKAVVKHDDGRLEAIPPHIWRGDMALIVFTVERAMIRSGDASIPMGALLVRADADSWLAKQGAASTKRKPAGAAKGKLYKDSVVTAAVGHFDEEGFGTQAEIVDWIQTETARRDGEGGLGVTQAKTWAKEVIERLSNR